MSISAGHGLPRRPTNWKTRSARCWRENLWARAKSGEWDATSQTWNERLAARRGMDADSAGGTGYGEHALWQTGRASVIACAFVSGGAVYLQPRHRSDHFSFLLDVSPAGRGRAVFSAELFRRKETCAADRGCNPIAGDATVATGAAEAEVCRRASPVGCGTQSHPELGRARSNRGRSSRSASGPKVRRRLAARTAGSNSDRDETPHPAAVRHRHVLEFHLPGADRKSTRLNSSHLGISYAVFCLKKQLDPRGMGPDASDRSFEETATLAGAAP